MGLLYKCYGFSYLNKLNKDTVSHEYLHKHKTTEAETVFTEHVELRGGTETLGPAA